MEHETYKAVRTEWGWEVQGYTPRKGGRCILRLGRDSTGEYARRLAALFTLAGHLSVEALESGRFELVEKVTA